MKSAGITTFALVMLITGAVDSIRNLPAASLFGTSLIFFYIFSALVFLIPTALVSADLSSRNEEASGIFAWVQRAFGNELGFIAIWLQWVTNLVWFPTILSFVAGVMAYLINPAMAQNKIYLITVILIIFWSLTLLNLRGLKVSARFASFCAIFGMIIPMTLIISLGLYWVLKGEHNNIHFTLDNLLPTFNSVNSWTSLTAIMTAFAGMELAAVHIRDIKNPQRTFPRALCISVWLILITMILGSLSIAVVLPQNDISLVNGVMQAFTSFFAAYHITWMMPIITVMILIGSLGGIVSWVISPAKGLLQAAQLGYLPLFLRKENKHGVAANLLIVQAIIVSGVCSAFLFMPSVSGSYWLLTALSTQLYMLMYVLMFFAALVSPKKSLITNAKTFRIPGGTIGKWIVCLLGLTGCVITLIVGFIPPDGVNVGGGRHYDYVFCLGMLGMTLPVLLFFIYRLKTMVLA